MKYCIINDDKLIINIIICNTDTDATKFGAIPFYEGAQIGDLYNPPDPEPKEPTTEEILLELAADHEARICMMELGV